MPRHEDLVALVTRRMREEYWTVQQALAYFSALQAAVPRRRVL